MPILIRDPVKDLIAEFPRERRGFVENDVGVDTAVDKVPGGVGAESLFRERFDDRVDESLSKLARPPKNILHIFLELAKPLGDASLAVCLVLTNDGFCFVRQRRL